jgi:hypothetical protein
VYAVLLTLIVIDLVFLGLTGGMGMVLSSAESARTHLLMGVLAAMLCCFTHVLVLFYLIGTGKDVREAVEEDPELAAKYVPWTRLLKRQVFPWATLATASIIVAALMGAEVHSRLILGELESGVLPFRAVPGWWVHLAVVLAAVALNLIAFRAELKTVRQNRRGIEEINRLLAAREDSKLAA